MWASPGVIGKGPTPRAGHTMTKVRSMTGVSLFVFGGHDGRDYLSDAYLYQCGSDTWIQPKVKNQNTPPSLPPPSATSFSPPPTNPRLGAQSTFQLISSI